MRRRRSRAALAVMIAVTAIGCFGCFGCSRNPATGRTATNLYNEEQEALLGKEASAELEDGVGLYPDEALASYVRGIGKSLAAASERPGLQWEFDILDTEIPNAFAVPGGRVYVTRGLLGMLTTEAQLAAVLAHEIGHVTARHAVEALSREVIGRSLQVEGVFGGVGALSRHVRARRRFAHSRAAELEADALALRYLRATGYDPRAMPQSIDAIDGYAKALEQPVVRASGEGDDESKDLEQALPGDEEEDGVPRWAKTHPGADERVLKLAEALTDNEGGTLNATAYLAQIDGIVYGPDPRSGYFDGDLFVHPRRAYTVSLPPNWAAIANGESMIAVPEADDEVAIMLWFTAEEDTVDAARKQFFEDVPLPRGVEWTRNLGDSESVAVGIGGHTRSGTVHGMVGFTAIRGTIMVVVAIAPDAAWKRLGAHAFESFSSLRVERRADRLGVEPVRLRVQAMPEGSWEAVDPGPIGRAELEALNQRGNVVGIDALGDAADRVKVLEGTWPGQK